MADLQAGGHDFNEAGGRCQKCDMTWAAFWDRDSKDFH